MSEAVVTQYWMLGVMGIMVAFAICAVVGTYKSKEK